MFEDYTKHDIAAYAGYIDNKIELLQCTSGGLATALSKKMIEDGGYVVGVRYSDDFKRAQYDIFNDINDIDKLKGSKYIEVEKGTVYKDVKQLLDEGKSVLFFGLPCMVGAMKAFLKKDYENLLTVELICHGPANPKVHQQYVDHLEKKYKSKIVDFSVRKKVNLWEPAYLYAKFENGKTFLEEFYKTEYGYAFGQGLMTKNACFNCKFRGNARVGDIMLGDYWGITDKDIFWNEAGVSSILVHSNKGLNFLKSTKEIKLFETTVEHIIQGNPNIIKPRKISPDKEKFEKMFEERGLFYAVRHTKSFKQKVRESVPNSIIPVFKNMYHVIKNDK